MVVVVQEMAVVAVMRLLCHQLLLRRHAKCERRGAGGNERGKGRFEEGGREEGKRQGREARGGMEQRGGGRVLGERQGEQPGHTAAWQIWGG